MFGFVTINQKELTDKEQDRYLQIYCGQCHALGERLGQVSRFTLSHDMTFMALLHLSLYEPAETIHESGCLMHPVKKRLWSQSIYTDYAGDMTVALMYHKLRDDVRDDGSKPAQLGLSLLRSAYNEVASRWPRQCGAIEEGLRVISEIEADDGGNPDAAANVFGQILGEIFVIHEDFWEDTLRNFGAQLGRFIYMMDAAVDFEKDRKTHSYNPLVGRGLSEEDIEQLLMNYMEQVAVVFERMPLVQDDHLLRNVIYSGVWAQFNQKKKKDWENSTSSSGTSFSLSTDETPPVPECSLPDEAPSCSDVSPNETAGTS